jgi:hypothetical protein
MSKISILLPQFNKMLKQLQLSEAARRYEHFAFSRLRAEHAQQEVRHMQTVQNIVQLYQPELATKDIRLGELSKVLENRERCIRQLKGTLKQRREFETYDPNVSDMVRELLFFWREHYVCRHFINGNCHNSRVTCTRIHSVCGSDTLKLDIDLICQFGQGRFIDFLYSTVLQEHASVTPLVFKIREYMYQIAYTK